MSDTLFDVDPWREATAAEVKVGDWIKGLGWPWAWKCVVTARRYPNGSVQVDTARKPGGEHTGGYMGTPDARVLIYRGTPPAEECAA